MEVAYKPRGTVDPKNADVIKSQIPPYDDVGISYKGYSKTKISSTEWKLNPQTTRFTLLKLPGGSFGSLLSNRPTPEKTFYCTRAVIMAHQVTTHSLSLAQMHIADVDDKGHASVKFYLYPTENDFHWELDFTDCPRKFSGNRFDFYTQASLGGTEFMTIQLFGWEE